MSERETKVIRVERYGDGEVRLTIDGQPFPYPLDQGGVRVITAAGYQPGVTITLPAETVEVVDSLAPEVPAEEQERVASYLASKAPPSSWRPTPRQ
jgi:hypothetical protein